MLGQKGTCRYSASGGPEVTPELKTGVRRTAITFELWHSGWQQVCLGATLDSLGGTDARDYKRNHTAAARVPCGHEFRLGTACRAAHGSRTAGSPAIPGSEPGPLGCR